MTRTHAFSRAFERSLARGRKSKLALALVFALACAGPAASAGGQTAAVTKDVANAVANPAAAALTDAAAGNAPLTQPPGWVLDWHDEFDGPLLDRTKWRIETGDPHNGNHESQTYTGRPDNLRLNGGMLIIEARRERMDGKQYTSARINSSGLQERAYGRYEARIRIPRGQGIWPAFWLLGADCKTTGWPRCGEIDIMENIGKEPDLVHGTMHGPGYSGADGFGAPQKIASGTYADGFHVYALEWEPGEVRWYRDGILYHTARPDTVHGDWVYEHPFFVILNLAVGGDWPGYPDATTTLPQRMLVDYVRVFRRAKDRATNRATN